MLTGYYRTEALAGHSLSHVMQDTLCCCRPRGSTLLIVLIAKHWAFPHHCIQRSRKFRPREINAGQLSRSSPNRCCPIRSWESCIAPSWGCTCCKKSIASGDRQAAGHILGLVTGRIFSDKFISELHFQLFTSS